VIRSRTAEGVAAVRAATALDPGLRDLFQDPLAPWLIPKTARLVLGIPPLRRAWLRRTERLQLGMVHDVGVRARYALDRLALLSASGMRQAVILGAGMDATAWLAGLPDDLVVFEIDHPGSQQHKSALLSRLKRAPLRPVHQIPADFSAAPGAGWLARGLRTAGFREERPAFVTTLGLLTYLEAPRVRALLEEAARACAPGSELVVSWFSREVLDPLRRTAAAARVASRVARIGEPFLSAFDPAEMFDLLRASGWRVSEHLDGDGMTRRYLSGRGRFRVVAPFVNLARAERDSPPPGSSLQSTSGR